MLKFRYFDIKTNRFHMTCMWEQVEGGGGGYDIAVIVKKTCISGEGGGVTGNVHYTFGLCFNYCCEC